MAGKEPSPPEGWTDDIPDDSNDNNKPKGKGKKTNDDKPVIGGEATES